MEKNGAISPKTPDPDKTASTAKSEQEMIKMLDADLVKQASAVVAARKSANKE